MLLGNTSIRTHNPTFHRARVQLHHHEYNYTTMNNSLKKTFLVNLTDGGADGKAAVLANIGIALCLERRRKSSMVLLSGEDSLRLFYLTKRRGVNDFSLMRMRTKLRGKSECRGGLRGAWGVVKIFVNGSSMQQKI
ncbi:hypothetical protein CDAR_181881 [Caerostris darwini]|uniref:Uncharacterized protein n=1 Tax=Caerostris darwini TaxID=1538125 RepID=A0AAV4PCA8_9ARAC|nr:hypothetical protein CDAR_181881 [Caerostris darwini]